MTNKRTILVVDDEASIRLFLKHSLKAEGYQVEAAASVEEANKIWDNGKFDLVMLDKNLPDGTGLELARRFSQENDDTELVLMSGFANLSSAVEAMQCSVSDYFIKPFDLPDMKARLARVFALQNLKRQNVQLVTELETQNAKLMELAVRDQLTMLYNHAHLQHAIEREVLRGKRGDVPFGMLLIDLDNFKEVNDEMGHLTGDRVLTTFAEIVTGKTRRTDTTFRTRGSDVASRYGGDEFALLLPGTDKVGAAVVGENLRKAIEAYPFDEQKLPRFSISVGAASFPADASDRMGVLAAADAALYAAKRAGRNTVIGYSESLAAEGKDRATGADRVVKRVSQLNMSIEQSQFNFVYQPIVDVEAWKPIAYEALCRTTNRAFKHVGEVIEIAERSGKITPLGRVLRRGGAAGLQKLDAPTLLFINLHPQELNDPQLHDISELGIPPELANRVVFEITETADITNFGHARDVIARLRTCGLRVALDDLGAGYSGFNSLTMLEPDFVKLDMKLVQRVEENQRTARLIQHLVEFCNDVGAQVIAEGIETLDNLKKMRELGVNIMQGYYMAKPAPPFCGIIPRPTDL